MIRTPYCIASVAVVMVASVGLTIEAQTPGPRAHHQQPPLVRVGRLVGAPVIPSSFMRGATGTDTVEIIGLVQNQESMLVPNAGTVLLRDLNSGLVIGTAQVNDLAQFTLRAMPPGLYMTELVGRSGAVIASSAAFTAAAGELVQIAHTVPAAPLTRLASATKSITSLALGAAASGGVLAMSPGAPVTPGS